MDDLQKAFDEGFEAVRGYVDRSFEAFERRIAAVEERAASIVQPKDGAPGEKGADGKDGLPGIAGRDGIDGKDGKSVTVDECRPLIEEAVSREIAEAVKAIRVPEDGAPGKDGLAGRDGRGVAKLLTDANGHLLVTFTDGAVEDVGLVVGKDGTNGRDGKDGADGAPGEKGDKGDPGERGADGAPGRDGVDGAPGRDGNDGRDGQQGERGDRGEKGLDGKDGRPGVDGAPGKDGTDGAPGLNGKDGRDGLDGKDGVGLADAMIDREGNLVLTMTDGRHKSLGIVMGKDGQPGRDGTNGAAGKDGTDGLGFDDMSVDYDGERTITLRFQRDQITKEFPLVLPIVLDKGVWTERGPDGGGYRKGDGVTWGGQFYIARKDTFAKPDDYESWRLSVKRGKDAKEPVVLK